jgi:hypothetical protein
MRALFAEVGLMFIFNAIAKRALRLCQFPGKAFCSLGRIGDNSRILPIGAGIGQAWGAIKAEIF